MSVRTWSGGRVTTHTDMSVWQHPTMAESKRPLAEFGIRLRAAIERSDSVANRSDLLRKIGMQGTTLYRYETGERSPTLKTVRKIARALGADPADLVGPSSTRSYLDDSDSAGWADFVRRGYVQLFLARGATPEMIESCRRETRFKGSPTWKDYVVAMEDRMDELEGEAPQAIRDARDANLELERDLSAFVKAPAGSKKDR